MCLPWRTSWYFWHPKGYWKIQEENEGWSISQTCDHSLSWRCISCSLGLERTSTATASREGPWEAVSDHPESSDMCPWCLPVDRWRKTGSLENQEEGRAGEKVLLLPFSQGKKKKKHVLLVFLQNLVTSIMTAQCGKFRHFKKYDMKTFKSNSSPGNYGLQDLF